MARTLLLSPLGGLDPTALRLLGRVLRDAERAGSVDAAHPLGRLPRPSDRLVRDALLRPEELTLLAPPGSRPAAIAERAARLARLVRDAAELVAGQGRRARGAVGAVERHAVAAPARARLDARGPAGRAADRDLDVVVALFDLAARDAERIERSSAGGFLDEVLGAADPGGHAVRAGVRGEGVRVLTAHRSKGLEWPVVVVVDVQEDVWPDLGHRGHAAAARAARRRRPERTDRPRPSGWPRSGGCSTSPRRGPAGGWWSPRSTRRRTTACARPGSWPSSGVDAPGCATAAARR